MKFNKFVSSDRRKNRKRHYTAPSHVRRWKMKCRLSLALCKEYGCPGLTMPIHKDDVVRMMSGRWKDEPPSKVVRVHRAKYRIYTENIQREKCNGTMVKVPVPYSQCIITKLSHMGWERQKYLKKRIRMKLRARTNLGFVPNPAGKKDKSSEPTEARVDLD